MRLATRTRTFVLLATIVLLMTGCARQTPQAVQRDLLGGLGNIRILYETDYAGIYSITDMPNGNICYIVQNRQGVAISCLPLESTNAP